MLLFSYKDEKIETQNLKKSLSLHAHLTQSPSSRKNKFIVLVKDKNPFSIPIHTHIPICIYVYISKF